MNTEGSGGRFYTIVKGFTRTGNSSSFLNFNPVLIVPRAPAVDSACWGLGCFFGVLLCSDSGLCQIVHCLSAIDCGTVFFDVRVWGEVSLLPESIRCLGAHGNETETFK